MATDFAPVTPAVMRWARESIGASLQDAAARAGVAPERIEAWEKGEAEPTVAKLRALAKLYQRPLATFFLPEPPLTFDTMRDFRKLPDAGHEWSRPLHKVYRLALDQQAATIDLLASDGAEPPPLGIPALSTAVPAEEAAAQLRSALGVELDVQWSWRRPEDSFTGWMEAAERLGVTVLRTSDVALNEMRGFSIAGAVPVVVVNALDWPRGQTFTLLHELAHLMTREGGLCDLLEPDSHASRVVEMWCNAVAAASLMPAAAFLDNPVVGPLGVREWEDDVIGQLSMRYGVSQEAVLRRLVTLNRASYDLYLLKRREYLLAYDERREAERQKRKQSPGGPPPYRMTVRDRGRPFVRLVLDAYYRDSISPSSVSNLLSLKLRWLADLEHEVGLRG